MVETIEIEEQIKHTNAYACLECGKCTSVCPISRYSRRYSPRILLNQALKNDYDDLFQDYDLWSCLTCGKCDEVCPSGIHYIDLTQILRSSALAEGFNGKCSHAGALQSLSRIMTGEQLRQNRLEWVADDMQTAAEGDILYFVGCAPYFDVLFSDLDISTLEAAESSIRLLNRLDITPVLMTDERCCGHDLLWNGDVENFKRLAEHNLKEIEKTGAKTILFSCAECLSGFKNLYTDYGFSVKAELKHMSQFLAEKLAAGELQLTADDTNVTFQDPCRLGRHLGIYDEPRQVLTNSTAQPAGSTNHFHDMKETGKRSLCCGVSAWMNCDLTSKTIQTERLRQAHDTGAEVLAVACPKCQIHLTCTMKDKAVSEKYGVRVRDIAAITLERMA
ncbi:MAG: (Fe-S)-binding protein [Fidelibacterota bacterium]|nr:MAG: (Fe-S)-binding protein [Candidatus Neomarinimicrobiota bacterium]